MHSRILLFYMKPWIIAWIEYEKKNEMRSKFLVDYAL